jgi:hypothetical protein
MKKITFVLIVLATVPVLCAQNTPALTQVDAARAQRETDQTMRDVRPGDEMPALYEDENADVGPQTVLRKKKHQWFRGTVDAQVFYTDNMLYQERDEEGAALAVTSLEAALLTPPCITRFASYRAEAGYRHQFFNYFGNDDVLSFAGRTLDAEDFDFDSSTVFATLRAQTRSYQFSAGVDYTRLLGFKPIREDDYEDFYSEVVPRWSAQRNLRVCDRSMISLAYLGSYHFTDEDPPIFDSNAPFPIGVGIQDDRSERWEHTLLVSYTMALPCDVAVQPFYRFQYNDFVNTDNYLVHTVGLSAGWYPCANFSVRGFVGYHWSEAENSRAVEYTKLDAGAGLTATLRF